MAKNWVRAIGLAIMPAFVLLAFSQVALAADPTAGQAVYKKNSCDACHGAKGEGGMGPALTGTEFARKFGTADKLTEVIQKGTAKGMPGYGEDKIDETAMADLVAYVQVLGQVTAPASTKAGPTTADAPAEAKAKTSAAVQPTSDRDEASANGFTLAQRYASIVAVIGVLLILFFVVVLNGPLRVRSTQ